MNSTNEAITVDHDDLQVFGNAFFEILNETTNGHADDTLPMAMALSVLDNGYGQSTVRLPIFSDMTSVVTPDMPIDDTTQDDDDDHQDETDFVEETFSTVSDLSFDESHIHDNGDDDDDDDEDDDEFDMDDEIAKITFDDEDNEHDVNKDDDKTQTTQFSFDLSFLLDNNNVNAETATPIVQQQAVMPMMHNTTTAVDTTSSPVMTIIDLTDDETDTPHDRTVHTPIPVETAIPAAPMEIVDIPDDDDDDNNNDNNSTTLDTFAHDVMYAMDVSMDNLDNMRTVQLPAMTSIVAG